MKALAWLIALIGLAIGANVSAADKPTPAKPADEHEGVVLFLTDGPEGEHYWIGLEAHPLSAEQQDKFEVQGDQGLLIEEVTPDSPAAKAGLKVHDILLEAGKKPLKQIADLAGAIQESKDQPLRLEVNRGGKRQTIAVTPAKRPGGGLTFRLANPEIRLGPADAAAAEKPGAERSVRKAIDFLQAARANRNAAAMKMQRRASRLSPFSPERHELQQNMKGLNEQLRSVSNTNNPDLATAEITRAEMRAAEEQIEAINRQTVMLELRQGIPYRQKLTRQLMTLRQCAADLAEVGRTEEASHLGSAAHEVEQQLQAIDLGAEQRRLLRVNDAVQLLNKNGLQEQAELLSDASQSASRAIDRRENESNRQQSEAICASNNSGAKPPTAESARSRPTRRSSVFAIRSSKCIARWRN